MITPKQVVKLTILIPLCLIDYFFQNVEDGAMWMQDRLKSISERIMKW